MINLSSRYMGLELKNPLVVASCGLTKSVHGIQQAAEAGAGAIILKSLFEEQISAEIDELTHESQHSGHTEDYDNLQGFGRSVEPMDCLNLVSVAKSAVSVPNIASVNCVTAKRWTDYSLSKIELLRAGKLFVLLVMASVLLTSCHASSKSKLGVVDSRLTSCPSSPNCVSSDTENTEQQVKPFKLNVSPEKAWGLLIEQVSQGPRTQIVRQDSHYLHIECRSQLFGFVDDLEFLLRPEQNFVAVRSASRTGYYDFGVNRSRIEKLRLTLQEAGIVQ
jgi:uncharacterized protein (DUF1499 family)